MPILSPRQTEILALARDGSRLEVEALAARFGVTSQTIRKDLNELCDQGLLQRYHGGAMMPSGIVNLAYESRRQLATDAKRRIGMKAAELIPNDCSLLINIGTTTEQVATALRSHKGLLVITNNLNVAMAFARNPDVEITMAGGTLRPFDRDIIGDTAVRFFSDFKADIGIFGVGGIDDDGALLDFYAGEVQARQAIAANCRTSLLVADASKFGRNATVRGGHFGDCHYFFTDTPIPESFRHLTDPYAERIHVAQDGKVQAA